MRSKPKARKLTHEPIPALDDSFEQAAHDVEDQNATLYDLVNSEKSGDPEAELPLEGQDDEDLENEVNGKSTLDEHPPVYIPEDLPIPEDFELRESNFYEGLGVWTKIVIEREEKFGPFAGVLKASVTDPSSAWEIVDELGKVKGWIDSSEVGTGNWMKYVRSAPDPGQQNVMAVQVEDQVFYKAIRDIQPAEEMLLYVRDAVYPEKDLESMQSSLQEERVYPCERCGELFRSKVALRRHETYVCNNSNAIFSQLNKQFKENMQQQQQQQQQQIHHLQQQQQQQQQQSQNHIAHPPIHPAFSHHHVLPSVSLPQLSHPPLQIHSQSHDSTELQPSLTENSSSDFDNSRDNNDGGMHDGGLHDDGGMSEDGMQSEISSTADNNGMPLTFPCENCDKIFTDPSNLQRHIRSQHVGARSHACTECGKTFATSSGLKQHQHIHSSVKPFQCEVCLKAYTQFSNLCRHKRMHADCRQQIKCKDCGQAFSTMTSLSKHKRFCEGILRNGARFGLPTPDGKSPLVPVSTPSGLSPALMNFYGPRPPFPFYSPMGPGFPIFPTGHPLPPLPPPVLPATTKLPSTEITPKFSTNPFSISNMIHSDNEEEREREGEPEHEQEPERRKMDGSTGSDNVSELSMSSDLDVSTGGSDNESDSDHHGDKTPQQKPNVARVLPLAESTPKSAEKPKEDSGACDLSVKDKSDDEEERPFDLSKSSVGVKEGPLDLSVKVKEDIPRKTHIFGCEKTPPPSEPKPVVIQPKPTTPEPPVEKPMQPVFPSYAGLNTPMMLDNMIRMDNEKMVQQMARMQDAVRMMPFGAPRLPMSLPAPYPTLNPSYMNRSLMNPMMKMDHSLSFSPGLNKLKERYACKFCGKIFPRSANLTRHLRTHTGEQPYKCKYCERSFSISSNLQRHVRNIHNKEKPFKCPLCERCFGQQTNLDRHLKKHETDGPNVLDSPNHGLDEREDSYFSEIRNFIGKTTDEEDSPIKEYDPMSFAMASQMATSRQMMETSAVNHSFEDSEDEDMPPSAKRLCIDNNNDDDEEEVKVDAKVSPLANGFHDVVEDIVEEEEEEEEEELLEGVEDLSNHCQETPIAMTTPLVIST